jgi:hypothetical protein
MEQSIQDVIVHELERKQENDSAQARDQADQWTAQSDSTHPRRRPEGRKLAKPVAKPVQLLGRTRNRPLVRYRHRESILGFVG